MGSSRTSIRQHYSYLITFRGRVGGMPPLLPAYAPKYTNMTKTKKTEEKVIEEVPVLSEREKRWEAFLVEARKVNPERFDWQKANGDFNSIPDSFK